MNQNQPDRIAFYAPLKSPTSTKPSGDRLLARLLIKSLERAGYDVELASEMRALDINGNADHQQTIRDRAQSIAQSLINQYQRGQSPQLWFSYHLYHKAPDWIGPAVSAALDIPYVVAEASYAPKQAHGHWQLGHEQVARALASLDGLIVLNPIDLEMVKPELKSGAQVLTLPALIDTETFSPPTTEQRKSERQQIALENGLDRRQPWLLTVAMMRSGDKQRSFEFLQRALNQISSSTWQLLIAGDGEARSAIENTFQPLRHRVRFLGQQSSEQLARLYSAADIMVWPAVNEAIGMALLEAQACGLPVVAGRSGGVATVVEDQHSGLVVDIEHGERAFAEAVESLLADQQRRQRFAQSAVNRVTGAHSLQAAAESLQSFLRQL